MKNLPWTLGFTTSGHSAVLLHLLPLFCVSCRIDHDIIIVIPFGLFSESIMLMWTQCAVVPGGWRLQCHTHFTMRDSTFTHWCPTPYQPPRKHVVCAALASSPPPTQSAQDDTCMLHVTSKTHPLPQGNS